MMNEYTDWFWAELKAKNVMIMTPRSAIKHNVGVEVILSVNDEKEVHSLLEKIRAKDRIDFAIESIRKNTQRS